MNHPTNNKMVVSFKWLKDPDRRHLILILPPVALVLFLTISLTTTTNPSSPFTHIQYLFTRSTPLPNQLNCDEWEAKQSKIQKRIDKLNRGRMAICLVGGARRFETTGPSIMKNILKVYPNADLFLHSPLDQNSYKLSYLMVAPSIASVRIFKPQPIQETESQKRVLTRSGSPNGIQGLLQYFNLVEGCLTMIQTYQTQNNFTYDWIVRTRVDGYWNAPLDPSNFKRGKYLVPAGSSYQGLNDRLGIGDLNTSTVALSRLSLIPQLESSNRTGLNSESAFKAQLTTQGIPFITKRVPFCIIGDRRYPYPPKEFDVPVASIGSVGPLSGAKCRPCNPSCVGECVGRVMEKLHIGWSWTNWDNGTLELCDAHEGWGHGWEKIFDRDAGDKLAAVRKRMNMLKLSECLEDFKEMKRRTVNWDAPPFAEICNLGLGSK